MRLCYDLPSTKTSDFLKGHYQSCIKNLMRKLWKLSKHIPNSSGIWILLKKPHPYDSTGNSKCRLLEVFLMT